jgi:hypothetical protein
VKRWLRSSAAIAIISCGGRDATPRPATGTLLCEPRIAVMGANPAELPDEAALVEALQREVIAQVTDEAFVRRVAVDVGGDEVAIARALSARPVKDSRIVEIDVALPDRLRARRVCDAILDRYTAERRAASHDDVQVLDQCRPPGSR